MARRRRSFARSRGFPMPMRPGSARSWAGPSPRSRLRPSITRSLRRPQEDVPLPPVDVTRPSGGATIGLPGPILFKLPRPLKDTPQSINVVPQEILKEQARLHPARRAAQRHRHQPRRRRGRRPGRQPRRSAGSPARNDLFLDGVRDLGSYSRDTFNLESVEVLKGPSSVCSAAAPPAAPSTR